MRPLPADALRPQSTCCSCTALSTVVTGQSLPIFFALTERLHVPHGSILLRQILMTVVSLQLGKLMVIPWRQAHLVIDGKLGRPLVYRELIVLHKF